MEDSAAANQHSTDAPLQILENGDLKELVPYCTSHCMHNSPVFVNIAFFYYCFIRLAADTPVFAEQPEIFNPLPVERVHVCLPLNGSLREGISSGVVERM